MDATAILNRIDANLDRGIERLLEWLAIPSISTDPHYQTEVRRGGQWLVDELTALGFKAVLQDTAGHPVVFAHAPGAEASGSRAPHVLFYGHYDVQPPDPLEGWETPPFEPAIVEGSHGPRIVARGAADDKGQVAMFIEALRAWKDCTGELPCPVTCVVEGEEECGSRNLGLYLKEHRDELVGDSAPNSPCDLVLVCDTGMWDRDTPAITTSLRGMMYLEVTLHGPCRDLHSGAYGNCVPNPINELTRILGGLFDQGSRRIAVPGFYDDVVEPTPEQREAWADLDFNERAYLAEAGFESGLGEAGYSTLERQWIRPSCDINGIVGGYIGDGAKTVITTHASAKLSCRLVPNQDPGRVKSLMQVWLSAQVPPGCRMEFIDHVSARPCVISPDNPYLQVAVRSLEEATGATPRLIGTGGSIPVVEQFKSVLGLDSLLIGFSLPDDHVHSPNEKFEVGCFSAGARSLAVLLGRLAESGASAGG